MSNDPLIQGIPTDQTYQCPAAVTAYTLCKLVGDKTLDVIDGTGADTDADVFGAFLGDRNAGDNAAVPVHTARGWKIPLLCSGTVAGGDVITVSSTVPGAVEAAAGATGLGVCVQGGTDSVILATLIGGASAGSAGGGSTLAGAYIAGGGNDGVNNEIGDTTTGMDEAIQLYLPSTVVPYLQLRVAGTGVLLGGLSSSVDEVATLRGGDGGAQLRSASDAGVVSADDTIGARIGFTPNELFVNATDIQMSLNSLESLIRFASLGPDLAAIRLGPDGDACQIFGNSGAMNFDANGVRMHWTSAALYVEGSGTAKLGSVGSEWGLHFQAKGADIASAATIAPDSPFHNLTGTTGVSAITPPVAGFIGEIGFVIKGASVTFSTGGNIQKACTVPQNAVAKFFFDGSGNCFPLNFGAA